MPLLVTTADHALLETALAGRVPGRAARPRPISPPRWRGATRSRPAAPDTRRTWLRFADGDYSGCNLFLLARPAAGERDRLLADARGRAQAPAAHGAPPRLDASPLRYALGRLSMAAAAARLGELAGGARFAIVALSDGRAAIDVDKPDDLDLVRRLVGAAPRPARATGL